MINVKIICVLPEDTLIRRQAKNFWKFDQQNSYLEQELTYNQSSTIILYSSNKQYSKQNQNEHMVVTG